MALTASPSKAIHIGVASAGDDTRARQRRRDRASPHESSPGAGGGAIPPLDSDTGGNGSGDGVGAGDGSGDGADVRLLAGRRAGDADDHGGGGGGGGTGTGDRARPEYNRYFHTRTYGGRAALMILGVLLCWAGAAMCTTLARSLAMHWEMQRGVSEVEALQAAGVLDEGHIPILMPVYGRPEYVRQVLDGLAANAGASRTVLVVSQDGDNEAVSALVRGFKAMPVVHLRHWRPYWGLPGKLFRSDYTTASNVYFLLRFALDRVGLAHGWRHAIVLESDLLPGADMYQYFSWMARNIDANATLRAETFTVNGFNMASRMPGADPYYLRPYQFRVWGWLCPRHTWPAIRDGWTWFHNWDITVEESVRPRTGRHSLSPQLSRVRNIGMTGINFDVRDADGRRRWEEVGISEAPIPYDHVRPRIDYTRMDDMKE